MGVAQWCVGLWRSVWREGESADVGLMGGPDETLGGLRMWEVSGMGGLGGCWWQTLWQVAGSRRG